MNGFQRSEQTLHIDGRHPRRRDDDPDPAPNGPRGACPATDRPDVFGALRPEGDRVPTRPLGVSVGVVATLILADRALAPKFRACNVARPEGTQRAVQTLRVEGVEELVLALRAA